MALDIRLNQRVDLQLQMKLAPQIIQSIEILQLASADLEELIDAELDTNEFLELASTDTPSDNAEPDTSTDEATEGREVELGRLEDTGYFENEMPRLKSAINQEASDRKMEAMNNTADAGPSLHEKLLDQFTLLELSDAHSHLGRVLISHVNPTGRFDGDLEAILANPEFKIEPCMVLGDAEFVLSQIQSLEPPGIAARSIEECLLLQLSDTDPLYGVKVRLVREHLEDLQKNRRPKISRSLGISLRELDDLVHELADLDIQPGQSLAEESAHYIYPDILVEWTTEGYDVRLARQKRALQISPVFQTIYRSDDVPAEYKDEVRKRVESARWLISAIEQRQDTLLRVASRIVHYQRDFLDFGPHYLRPLKMQQVADDLGIHVSTVSRATHEKYIQTHRGIFSLKYFFSGATTNIDGGVESRTSVKQRVQEIIDGEDKHSPLSDEQVVKRLRESFGVDVARRTVTKYRKALSIPSTRQRRVF